MYKSAVLFLLVVFAVAIGGKLKCSHGKVEKRIVMGGFISSPDIVPYQVLLYITLVDNDVVACGGSIITAKFVLTAAHCLYNGAKIQVALGVGHADHMEHSRVFLQTSNFKYHENYVRGHFGYNDLGVIELPHSIEFNGHIKPVKLPSKSNTGDYIGSQAMITGWGRTENNRTSDILKFLKVIVVPENDCGFDMDSNYMICAVGKTGSTCSGDSGGPLILQNSDNTVTQIGIVSFGTDSCGVNHPTIYTRITRYLDWIEQHSDYNFTSVEASRRKRTRKMKNKRRKRTYRNAILNIKK